MSDLLGALPIGDLGLSGLVVLTVLLILGGRLVPRSTLEDMRADRDAWRAVAERQAPQIDKLVTNGETTLALLRAIPHPADEEPVT